LRQRFFVVPVDDRLVIEVEYSMKDGIPFPFVVRLMTEWKEEKSVFPGSTAPIEKSLPIRTLWDFGKA
jgi:hypothetical protein